MKIIALILFTLLVGCISPHYGQTATQQFFDLDVKLEHVNMLSYLDGGTIGLELTDIHGNRSDICIDNEGFCTVVETSKKDLPETIAYINRCKQKCIYIGATHPENKGAEEIEYHSERETAVLMRIHEMMTSNPDCRDEFSRFIEATKSERDLTVLYEDDPSKYE